MLPLNEITSENVFFLDGKKNILMEGIFMKINYMNEWFTMNGIYLSFPIKVQHIDVMGQKHIIYFSVDDHIDLIESIEILERTILEKYKCTSTTNSGKFPVYSIQYTLRTGVFKIYKESKMLQKNTGFAIKISGIWENGKNYGLSYKIMDAVIA
jgi:hypothetical protein